jgi:hypothetical protein
VFSKVSPRIVTSDCASAMFLGSMSRSGSYLSADTGMAKVPAGDWFATLGEYTVTAGGSSVSCAPSG